MNIILAEIGSDGEHKPERSFDQGTILVGRDASECDIAFDNELFPMVSRKHGEISWRDGRWFVTDLNSSYGTFVGGRPIAQPLPITAGTTIQFGADGPILLVVWFEAETESFENAPEPVVNTPSPIAAPIAPSAGAVDDFSPRLKPPAAAAVDTPPAALEFADSSRPVYKIAKSEIWLGRESDCDIIFDASSGTVSRKHASIRIVNGEFVLTDNNSFNGTLVNEQRIASPVSLFDGDRIRLGLGGPVLVFRSSATGNTAVRSAPRAGEAESGSKTIVLKLDRSADRKQPAANTPQLLMSVSFADKSLLTVGRDAACDIRLDGLQISKHHARLQASAGGITVEDLNSTNGVFVNGERISRRELGESDSVQIGSFLLRTDAAGSILVFDTRSKTRIDAVNITVEAKDRSAGGKLKLLDDVSFSIRPNEFIGILGPSGAGKSTLIKAMNGILTPSSGNVLINNLDLYRNFDSVKQQIGYVPQEDIIHSELSVYRTLHYIAKLRLSRDASAAEIARIIDEVLDVTGLSDRKNVQVGRLSGGQRKRVSMAVELLTKPAAIFLDEPTSGLDPSTEETIMRLFREIAESGRTVVMTTHVLENVRLFDKVILLAAGKLVFFGSPADALSYFDASNFKELFEKLEQPAVPHGGNSEDLRRKFNSSTYYKQNVREPLDELGTLMPSARGKKRRLGVGGSLSQLITLSRRYLAVLFKDKLNLLILFAQAPLIALLTYLVMDSSRPRDFVYFVVALVAFWFGISVAAREIIRERAVYKRERMFNLGILPYLFSKLFVLGLIVSMQCLMLFGPLKLFDLTGLMSMPGEMLGVPQFWAMLLTAGVGIACGLLVSTLVRTSEMATSLVPLILIPQILFSGLVGVPHGVNKVIGMAMPSAWSFDTMKRFSTLDTLEPEGADPRGATKGLGLYKSIEAENEKAADKAKRDLQEMKKIGGAFNADDIPPGAVPEMPELRKVPDDLSGYVSFLHPWMSEVLNQVVLMIMLGLVVFATIIALRVRDHVH